LYWFLDTTLAIVIGFLLDLLLGDPVFSFHPVRLIGKLITYSEKKLRKPNDSSAGDLRRGTVTATLVVVISSVIPFLLVWLCRKISRPLLVAVEALMCWSILSAKDLTVESGRVYNALARRNLPEARTALSMIVGRDTEALDEEGIIRATVETIAENTNDGEIAPLFYLMLGGVVFGYIYKAVNTLDSMIAYRNKNYYYFGRAAALADDIMNYIPARLSAFLLILSAGAQGFDRENAKRIHRRDAHLHDSPNSAQTEAVCAGALRIRLAGFISYEGVLAHKPELGDALKSPEKEDITRANKLMLTASWMMLIFIVVVRLIIFLGMIIYPTGLSLLR
jgi:adenosylcobinamide-phosphate synthase